MLTLFLKTAQIRMVRTRNYLCTHWLVNALVSELFPRINYHGAPCSAQPNPVFLWGFCHLFPLPSHNAFPLWFTCTFQWQEVLEQERTGDKPGHQRNKSIPQPSWTSLPRQNSLLSASWKYFLPSHWYFFSLCAFWGIFSPISPQHFQQSLFLTFSTCSHNHHSPLLPPCKASAFLLYFP